MVFRCNPVFRATAWILSRSQLPHDFPYFHVAFSPTCHSSVPWLPAARDGIAYYSQVGSSVPLTLWPTICAWYTLPGNAWDTFDDDPRAIIVRQMTISSIQIQPDVMDD